MTSPVDLEADLQTALTAALQGRYDAGFTAGAASRDAEVADLEHGSGRLFAEIDRQKQYFESLVEIRLRAIAEGTELTFTHSRLHDEETRRGHEEGWTGALDKLERHFLATERRSA